MGHWARSISILIPIGAMFNKRHHFLQKFAQGPDWLWGAHLAEGSPKSMSPWQTQRLLVHAAVNLTYKHSDQVPLV
jgi:hypothetical protein